MDFLIYKYTQTMHENCKEMRNSPFHFATFIHLLFNKTGKQFKKCIYSQNYTTLDHMNILGLKNEHNQSKIAPSCFSHNEICLNQHLFLHVRLPWHGMWYPFLPLNSLKSVPELPFCTGPHSTDL